MSARYLELVPRADHAAVGGLGQPAWSHVGQLRLAERPCDLVGLELSHQCGRERFDQGCCRSEWHQHRQQRRLADEQGGLRLPEHNVHETSPSLVVERSSSAGGDPADAVEHLLRRTDHKHGFSRPVTLTDMAGRRPAVPVSIAGGGWRAGRGFVQAIPSAGRVRLGPSPFLDLPAEARGAARRMAEHLTSVVRAATLAARACPG